jgi:SAM-dependent methyltransferase
LAQNVFDSPEAAARWRAGAERRERYLGEATGRMLDAAGVAGGARVLDLGTGAGDAAIQAARRVGPKGRVLATDISPSMLKAAADAAAAAGLGNLETRIADAGALDLEPASFDAVIARFALMFVPDLAAALHGVRRVLRPGGGFGALTWAAPEENPFLSLTTSVARRTGRLRVPEEQVGAPFRLADAAVLRAAAVGAGLAGVAVEPIELDVRARDAAGLREAMFNSPLTLAIVAALDAAEAAAYEADVVAERERYREGEGYRFPGRALLLSGRNP